MSSLYEKVFRKVSLIKEFPEVNASPDQEMSDEEIWRQANAEIADNEEISSKFDVEGIPPEVEQQYSQNIDSWKQGIDEMSSTLEKIYDFATKTSDKAGADKIFSEVSDIVENLLSGIGTLQGKMKYLAKKVNVLVARDQKKQRS